MGWDNPWLAGNAALGSGAILGVSSTVGGMFAQARAGSQQHAGALALMNQQGLGSMSYAEMNARILGLGGMGAILHEPEIPSAMDDWDADFLLQTGKEVRDCLMPTDGAGS